MKTDDQASENVSEAQSVHGAELGGLPVRCNCSMRTRLVGDGCEICNPELAEEIEADNIEMEAADKSYACGLGVSEWESFLTTESGARLAELARKGRGTWGKEGRIPEPYNSANDPAMASADTQTPIQDGTI